MNTPMNTPTPAPNTASETPPMPCQATDSMTLRKQITDCNVPKNEREWWAAREIEKLQAELTEARAIILRHHAAQGGEDARRLDWLERGGKVSSWEAENDQGEKTGVRCFELPDREADECFSSVRAAIDAAINTNTKKE
jgi:hypothetical protein